MIVGLVHAVPLALFDLLAQAEPEAHKKTAAEEGADIILSMLVVYAAIYRRVLSKQGEVF